MIAFVISTRGMFRVTAAYTPFARVDVRGFLDLKDGASMKIGYAPDVNVKLSWYPDGCQALFSKERFND